MKKISFVLLFSFFSLAQASEQEALIAEEVQPPSIEALPTTTSLDTSNVIEKKEEIPEFEVERTFVLGDKRITKTLGGDFWIPQKKYIWKVGKVELELNEKEWKEDPDIFGEVEEKVTYQINPEKVEEFLNEHINEIDKDTTVTLELKDDGSVEIDGFPQEGQQIDYLAATNLIQASLENNEEVLDVQMKESFTPLVISEELQNRGIKEIISIGSSDFTGSSSSRKVNIEVGMNKFLGRTIKQGETFSFNDIIVSTGFNEASGYVPELVIVGDKTTKELGGGLCQVSTSTYRAAFNAGLPIDARRSHSYAVPYYEPVGFDATIYLGGQDLKFTNDTPGEILIHPVMDGNELHFIFYGTKDREVSSEGPFVYNHKAIPAPKYELSYTVAPGGKIKQSGGYEGFNAHWNRTVQKYGEEPMETEVYKSSYRAEPVTYLVGPSQ